MSSNIHWVLECAVKPGQLASFRSLMDEMVAATRANEPGTLNYEWHLSADETTCHIYERYADSAATVAHVASFGKNFAERFLAALEPKRFTVYGNPSDDVKKALEAFGAVYMSPVGGFAR